MHINRLETQSKVASRTLGQDFYEILILKMLGPVVILG